MYIIYICIIIIYIHLYYPVPNYTLSNTYNHFPAKTHHQAAWESGSPKSRSAASTFAKSPWCAAVSSSDDQLLVLTCRGQWYPQVMTDIAGKIHHFQWENSTNSMVIFNSYVTVITRG